MLQGQRRVGWGVEEVVEMLGVMMGVEEAMASNGNATARRGVIAGAREKNGEKRERIERREEEERNRAKTIYLIIVICPLELKKNILINVVFFSKFITNYSVH